MVKLPSNILRGKKRDRRLFDYGHQTLTILTRFFTGLVESVRKGY